MQLPSSKRMRVFSSPFRMRAVLLALLVTAPLFPQSTHTDIKDPALAERFKKISQELMCGCGCGMVLDHCNHTVCVAWAMRSAIDEMLLAGKSDEYIISGFINGFGDIVDTDEAFTRARKKEYGDLIEHFRAGYGEKYRSYPRDRHPEIMILLAALLIGGVVALFIKKRLIKLGANRSPKETHMSKSDQEELYKKLYDD